jgi:hypothetical protein
MKQAMLLVIKWIAKMFSRLWLTLLNRPLRWFAQKLQRTSSYLYSIFAAIIVLVLMFFVFIFERETRKPFDQIDRLVHMNLHIVSPVIEKCITGGGAWIWDMGVPDAAIGACLSPADIERLKKGLDPNDDEGDPGMPPPKPPTNSYGESL